MVSDNTQTTPEPAPPSPLERLTALRDRLTGTVRSDAHTVLVDLIDLLMESEPKAPAATPPAEGVSDGNS